MLTILILFLLIPIHVFGNIDCTVIDTGDEYTKLYQITGYVSCPQKPTCSKNFDHNIANARFTQNDHGRCQINTIQYTYMQVHCHCTSQWHATEPVNAIIQVTMDRPAPPPPVPPPPVPPPPVPPPPIPPPPVPPPPVPPPPSHNTDSSSESPSDIINWFKNYWWIFIIISSVLLLCLICCCCKYDCCCIRGGGCDLHCCNLCNSWSCCSGSVHRAGYRYI